MSRISEQKIALRTCLLAIAALACAACTDDGGGDDKSLPEERPAEELCRGFCERLPETCPEFAADSTRISESEGTTCEERCLHGDEPDGGVQDVAYLDCLYTAGSCDDLVDCKKKF